MIVHLLKLKKQNHDCQCSWFSWVWDGEETFQNQMMWWDHTKYAWIDMFYIGKYVNRRLQREFVGLIPKERIVGGQKKNHPFNEEVRGKTKNCLTIS